MNRQTELSPANVEILEVDGVDRTDYPDFCDTYTASAWLRAEDREATVEELEQFDELNPGEAAEYAREHFFQE